jgi:ATP-binding cassette subfamily B protein RaxB
MSSANAELRPARPGLLARFWNARRLPLMLQSEVAECGLACLAMVASYWGQSWDLPALRHRFPMTLKGTTLKSLIGMAQVLGLAARPLKLDMPQLRELRLPCLLHWDMNHFVVLKSRSRRRAVLHDPAFGVRRMPLTQLATHFTGVALELAPDAGFAAAVSPPRTSWRRLLGRVVGLQRNLLQLLLLGLALQLLVLAGPFYLQWVVDQAVVTADRPFLAVLAIGFLLLTVVQVLLTAARSWTIAALAASLNFQWLGNLLSHLLRLPLGYFEKRHLADIVSRIGSVQSIQRALGAQLIEGIVDGVLVIGTLLMLLLYSPLLTAVAGAACVAYALLRAALFARQRAATAEQISQQARQQGLLLESIRGVQTLRLADRIDERRQRWLDAFAGQSNAELRQARLTVVSQAANLLLFGAERVLVVWLAALAVLEARFTLGMLFAFLSYQDQFSLRTASLIDRLLELRMLRLHAERVADIVLTEPEPVGSPPLEDPRSLPATIEMRRVSFRHGPTEAWVLLDFDLQVPAGQNLVIAGASGSGKTTLLKLLLGLYEPTSGEILIGGLRRSQLGMATCLELLAAVMQDDLLFAGSLAENISCFDAQPEHPQIVACARLAGIHDEIVALPMAYHTLVGDLGCGLSGGQKQRLLLARALYRRPRILLLDEATSQLDVRNERRISATLRQLPLTRISVAHRPETMAQAERVIVLEQGRVVRDLRRGSDPVDEHEQAEPHDVDEVPVPGNGFEAEVACRREMSLETAQPDDRQHDRADRHVKAVEAGQHEKG